MRWGELPAYRRGGLPPFLGWRRALGPGVVWMALAQGSAELIWWPYLVAKYGLPFLWLLIPACLLQFPLTYAIGSYTLLTGETILQGFIRVSRWTALVLWLVMTVSFFWFGAFASAGGTALAALTHYPPGWDVRSQTLFWAYVSMGVGFLALVASRVVYTVVERVMWVVAVVTVIGLAVACSHPGVLAAAPTFFPALVVPPWPPARPWEASDATRLLTAVTFAGLGGFWTLFYSYWLREKGAGMARGFGRVEGLAGRHEVAFETGVIPQPSDPRELGRWRRFLTVDSAIGIVGNIVTTIMTCWLAYALLHPEGVWPERYELAVVQSRFFEASWGLAGRVLFLGVAAAFLADTWMATADAVARIQTDALLSFLPAARGWPVRRLYLVCLLIGAGISAVTVVFNEPGPLILLSALFGFLGTVSFSAMLYLLNHRWLPRHVAPEACPGRWALVGLLVSGAAYAVLAVAYLIIKWR